jgi:hypothetical protein
MAVLVAKTFECLGCEDGGTPWEGTYGCRKEINWRILERK